MFWLAIVLSCAAPIYCFYRGFQALRNEEAAELNKLLRQHSQGMYGQDEPPRSLREAVRLYQAKHGLPFDEAEDESDRPTYH